MPRNKLMRCVIALSLSILCAITFVRADDKAGSKTPPAVGDKAPDFTRKDLDDKSVSLSNLLKSGPVVVVVLRGYPGYQCPICMRQFAELMSKAKGFAEAKATVVFIYPGATTNLDNYAKEFIGGKTFSENFRFVIDPDFKFTELYNLRWNAPAETAYPSSIVIDTKGIVRFAKVSHSHGGRASSAEILKALTNLDK